MPFVLITLQATAEVTQAYVRLDLSAYSLRWCFKDPSEEYFSYTPADSINVGGNKAEETNDQLQVARDLQKTAWEESQLPYFTTLWQCRKFHLP